MSDQTPTFYRVNFMKPTGFHQGDLHKALYNIYTAIEAICNNLDGDISGATYMSNIGTNLATAMSGLEEPNGDTVGEEVVTATPSADYDFTLFTLKAISGIGVDSGQIHKAIFNLSDMVYGACHQIDKCAGLISILVEGVKLAVIAAQFRTVFGAIKTPNGKTI